MLLGAEYWSTAESADEVDRDVGQMREHGFSLVRIFLPWLDEINVGSAEANGAGASPLWVDWVYASAKRHGLRVCPTFGAWSDPAEPRPEPYCLDNPEVLSSLAQQIAHVVRRYADHPAQGAWILRNEPSFAEHCRCADSLARFRGWLAAKYGSVGALSAAWRTRYGSIDEAEPPSDERRWTDHAQRMDWIEFGCWNLADQMRWMGERVKEIDRVHPTHANPHAILRNMTAQGQCLWEEGRALDILGSSVHPCHHFGALRRESGDEFRLGQSAVLDLVRSASREKRRFWVTELQGGPNLISGGFPYCPTPDEVQTWLWQAVGAGAEATVFWIWGPRLRDWEGGEYALLETDGRPSERLTEAARFAERLTAHADFFAQARPLPSRVAILYSRRNWALAAQDHSRRERSRWATPDDVVHSALAVYQTLFERGLAPDFIDTQELLSGAAERYRVLYLPELQILAADEAQAIKQYVKRGGTVWGDGLFAFRGTDGEVNRERPAHGLAEVFGCALGEPRGVTAVALHDSDNRYAGCFIRQELRPTTAEVLARYDDDQPAATINRFGDGCAYLVGTSVGLAQFRAGGSGNQDLLLKALNGSALPAVTVEESEHPVGVRLLANGQRLGVVLANHGPAQNAKLRLPFARSRIATVEGEPAQSDGAGAIRVRLAAGRCAVYVADGP